MKRIDDCSFISTNFLPWRFIAWFWYSIAGAGLMFGLYLAGVEVWVWALAGPILTGLLGAFNVCEPNTVMRVYEAPPKIKGLGGED